MNEPNHGSLPWLIREFQTQPLYAEQFESWSDAHRRNTLANWRWWLERAQEDAQSDPASGLPSVRAWTSKRIAAHLARPDIASKTTMRRYLKASLSLLMNVAVMEGIIERNPCADLRLQTPKTTFYAFDEDEVLALIRMAPTIGLRGPALARLIAIMSDIGQREGDALALRHGLDYAGGVFRFEQSKTGKRLEIPATGMLRAIIGPGADTGRPIVNWPASITQLRTDFRTLCRSIGIPDGAKIMHLRHRAVMRLRDLGFDAMDIAAITGHKPRSVLQMLERYSAPTSQQARTVISRVDEARGDCDWTTMLALPDGVGAHQRQGVVSAAAEGTRPALLGVPLVPSLGGLPRGEHQTHGIPGRPANENGPHDAPYPAPRSPLAGSRLHSQRDLFQAPTGHEAETPSGPRRQIHP